MRVKLEDVCERGTSNLMQKDIANKSGCYPVYGASGCIGSLNSYQQENKTVAVVKDGAGIGRTMLLPEKSSIIGTMQCLIPKDCVEPEYLYYVVKYMHLEKYFSGATIPHIYFRDYKTEEFNLHNRAEQKKIVDVLRKTENVIAGRQQQLSALDNLVKARFVEMFSSNKYSEMQLSQACKKISDGTHKTPKYLDHGITFISAKNIINGKLNFLDIKYIGKEEYQEIQRRCQTEQGDVLLAKSGSLGMTAIIDTAQPLGLFESLAIIKYDRTLLNGIFLCEQMRSEAIQNQLMAGAKGVAVKHLHLNVISSIKIIVPPLSLQNDFAAFVEEVDKSRLLCASAPVFAAEHGDFMSNCFV